MYLVLSDGWKLKRSDHEVWTPEGWRKTADLRMGDQVRNAYRRWVQVVEFL